MFSQTRTRQCVGWYICIVVVAIMLSSATGMMKKGKTVPPSLTLDTYEWTRDGIHKAWEFKDAVDEKLIGRNPGEGTLYNVIRAYKLARNKIEIILDDLTAQGKKRAFGNYIPAANYQATRMDAIVAKDGANLKRLAFPVEMQVKNVEIYRKANTKEYFNVMIDLDSPHDGYNGEGPHGPHVGYEVTGASIETIRGHLLIEANIPKDPNNPCPRLLPDRHCINENALIPNDVRRIRPERVLSGVEAFPGGANLNLWRVPMLENSKDYHFTNNFFLNSCKHYMDEHADKRFLPTVATFN